MYCFPQQPQAATRKLCAPWPNKCTNKSKYSLHLSIKTAKSISDFISTTPSSFGKLYKEIDEMKLHGWRLISIRMKKQHVAETSLWLVVPRGSYSQGTIIIPTELIYY
jgi:hypothetical protein